jgi:hypothetical protein
MASRDEVDSPVNALDERVAELALLIVGDDSGDHERDVRSQALACSGSTMPTTSRMRNPILAVQRNGAHGALDKIPLRSFEVLRTGRVRSERGGRSDDEVTRLADLEISRHGRHRSRGERKG